MSSLEGMISGDNFGLPLPADYFRNIQANCPSGLYLLPRLKPGLWTPDEVLVSTPSKNYTAGNLKSLYEDLGFARCASFGSYQDNPQSVFMELALSPEPE